jgi:moderate conductance mechanosensitive channel
MEELYNSLISPSLVIGLKLVLIVGLTLFGLWLVKAFSHRAEARIKELNIEEGRKARLLTLVSVVRGTVRILILGLTFLSFLATIGINITPLLTSLGIVGLALSLGAQTLIKDYIGGLFILLENQYIVGELVTLPTGNGTASGTVEKITMRATWVRDVNGQIHVVPNGEVRLLSNSSRDWSLAVVSLNLNFDTDMRNATEALQAALNQFANDPEAQPILLEQPQIQAWSSLTDYAIQLRLTVKVMPGTRIKCESLLRRYALEALSQSGISPSTPLQALRLQQ